MDAKPRDRVATPAEFAQLLAALKPPDALPWALAGNATAREQEIRVLDWSHVDLQPGAIELAAERVHRAWRELGLEPIGLHESRHTALGGSVGAGTNRFPTTLSCGCRVGVPSPKGG